jgi:hypothetical protein
VVLVLDSCAKPFAAAKRKTHVSRQLCPEK